ncbi:hypothetical protein [Sulfolobus ellipsoid virus 1]|uniref:Uncharacterized protein n=1 Tax=Sulfolobus ellipsoid virus 1 TaxID=2056194 RepID=A0A2H4RBP6_9VIRU|nr:hypothetical protein FGG62_gp31 [Sulfolobus ellipsoid virus 1]ATY46509.1 hypothetical protein [Sulfolobus ellipsoid virus 1]
MINQEKALAFLKSKGIIFYPKEVEDEGDHIIMKSLGAVVIVNKHEETITWQKNGQVRVFYYSSKR